jgi:hypothetical protein
VTPPPRAISRWLFVLVMVSCAYFVQGAGPNQNSRFALARAIVEDHTLAIDRFAASTNDRAVFDYRSYSDKAPGLALVAAIPYAVGGRALQPHDDVQPSPLALHAVTLATCSLATALAAVVLFELLVGLGLGLAPSLLAVVGWVLGTDAFAYATLFYAHQLVAALLVLALGAIHAAARGDARASRALAIGAGLALGFAVLSEYPAVVLAAGVAGYAVAHLGVRRAAPLAIGALVPALVLAAYDQTCFGSPLHVGYQSLANPQFAAGIDHGWLGFTPPRAAIVGELVAFEYRGLLPLSPFLALAVPGVAWMLRDRALRPLGVLCGASVVGFVLLMSGYRYWDGGDAMGPRYLVPALPFAIIPVAVAIDRLRARAPRAATIAACVLVGASIAICTAVVAVRPELPDGPVRAPAPELAVPDVAHPLTEIVAPLLAHGYVSQKATHASWISFAGLHAGHDDDAYNLGEAVGLPGAASLLPLALAWLICGVALVRRARGRGAPYTRAA